MYPGATSEASLRASDRRKGVRMGAAMGPLPFVIPERSENFAKAKFSRSRRTPALYVGYRAPQEFFPCSLHSKNALTLLG